MQLQCSVFIGTSADGFIARKDGRIDWLPPVNPDNDLGFNEFFDSCDFLVMGRNTFETVMKLGEWPYGKKQVIVLTHRELTIPDAIATRVEVMDAPPDKVARILEGRGAKRVYVDGGRTIQSFLDASLIDDITVTVIPVLIGEGIPLFGPVRKDIKLMLLRSETFADGGYVQNVYRVVRPPT